MSVEPGNDNDKVRIKKEKENAYEILGLKLGASNADIDKRYFVLVKKYNTFIKSGRFPDFDIEEATKSYNILMGYEQNKDVTKASSVGNFLHYNKWTIVAVIAGILFLISLIKVVTRPRPDFEIALFGSIDYIEDKSISELEDFIEEKVVAVEYVAVSNATAIGDDPYFVAPQKEAAIVSGGFIDVFIVDREKFEYYANAGLFSSLDEHLEQLGGEEIKDPDLVANIEGETEEHQFGIYVSDKDILKKFGIIADELIAGISYKSERSETAVEVLKLLTGH